jgi:hypothetical protein
MIEIGSFWKLEIWGFDFLTKQRKVEQIGVVKVIEVCAGDVIVSDISGETTGTSMERRMLLKHYTKLSPLEVELL